MRVLDEADQMIGIMKAAMVALKLTQNHEMTKFIRDPSMTEPDSSKRCNNLWKWKR